MTIAPLILPAHPPHDGAMRRAIPFAAALLAACGGHHEVEEGPAGLLYSCGEGRLARVFYEGGGDPARARARVEIDGQSLDMASAPAMTGLRYMSAGAPGGDTQVWQVEGDQAALTQVFPDSAREEREIARCSRVREGEVAPEPHPPDHH